ncbi:hypothetical protein GCM10022247_33410 [Allokutzneria multivorans]|uniref:Uncharacterized protein n=1 Tax=Allokutzneria multivorans TaxID=1142134 RepID=A0ABP7S9F4_9PSEU
MSAPSLAERVRSCEAEFRTLAGLLPPERPSQNWDSRPTWDDKPGGRPWDNKPSWDNWAKKR